MTCLLRRDVGKRNIRIHNSKLEVSDVNSFYERAFQELADEISEGVEAGKAYDMSSLLTRYISLLKEKGVDGQSYTKQLLNFFFRVISQIALFSISLKTKRSQSWCTLVVSH